MATDILNAEIATAATAEDPIAELAKLRAENARLQAKIVAKASSNISLKVGRAGGISVYGLGRFPVTLYFNQWQKLLAMSEEILAFGKAHSAELSHEKSLTA